jgi:hypothetical protein
MPIKVQCRCGRVLLVKDEMAGKTGRCPECQQPVKIPWPPPQEEATAELVDEEDTPRKRSQAIRSRRREDEDEEDEERPARRRRREDEDDDYDEDDRPRRKRTSSRRDEEEDYDDYDDRPRRRGKRGRPAPVDGLTITLLSIGIGALILLGVGVIPSVYHLSISASSKNKEIQEQINKSRKLANELLSKIEWPGFLANGNWRGVLMLILAILLAAAAVASLVLLLTVGRKLAEVFLLSTAAASAGWGVLVFLWSLGYVFKGFVMSRSESGGGPVGDVRVSVTFLPGMGLLMCVLLAAVVAGIFCPLVFKRGALWGLIGVGVGGLLGLVLMLVDAQPWSDPIKQAEKAAKESIKSGKPPPKQDKPWFFPEKNFLNVSNQNDRSAPEIAARSSLDTGPRIAVAPLHVDVDLHLHRPRPPWHPRVPAWEVPASPAFGLVA